MPCLSLKIPNKIARQIAIYSSGLDNASAVACNKHNLSDLIKRLGYVQLDPLQVVARAHDHILWSRNTNYRPEQLESLLEKDRLIFEHFCHDACVLPMESLPYWKHQFERKAKRYSNGSERDNHLSKTDQKKLMARLTKEGPLSSKDFKVPASDKKRAIWTKPAHKQTLDYLWLTGSLAVSRRDKFTKYYDLSQRIYPQELIDTNKSHKVRIDWLSTHALDRLGFATASEIKQFWDATSLEETKLWCQQNEQKTQFVQVESATGEYADAVMLEANSAMLQSPPQLSKKLKIINPFDPIVRDRKRLERLFNFEYRIEIYIPPEKRRYGYYVYPLLEYDKFVGRIEVRHDRMHNLICVDNMWNEPNVAFGKQRMAKLQSELERLKRFCGARMVKWST